MSKNKVRKIKMCNNTNSIRYAIKQFKKFEKKTYHIENKDKRGKHTASVYKCATVGSLLASSLL